MFKFGDRHPTSDKRQTSDDTHPRRNFQLRRGQKGKKEKERKERNIKRMDGWTDGWMDGWTDGRMDGWTDGRMDGWTDGETDRESAKWMGGWTKGRTDGRTNKMKRRETEEGIGWKISRHKIPLEGCYFGRRCLKSSQTTAIDSPRTVDRKRPQNMFHLFDPVGSKRSMHRKS